MQPDKLCAPVTAVWTVTYRGVDDGGTNNVSIFIDWGDGTSTEVHTATEYEPNNWQVTASHVYPKGGDQCNYEPRTMLMVDGVACPSSVQTQLVTVWDVDDENGGQLNINPLVFPICLGNDGTIQFTDASQWNCTPPLETDNPNTRNRWTQWVYGTGSTTITTAQVNGVQYPWPYTSPIDYYSAPILAPEPPPSLSESIYIPLGYNVGDFFEVTLRNWNTCNPYDDPNIPGPPADAVNGDNPPIETTAMALIVALPDGTITPVGPFCENSDPVLLSPATIGGSWSGTGVDPATGLFDPNEAGEGTHLITYDVTDPNGCSASGSLNIEVKNSPKATIAAGAALTLCPGITQTLTANLTGGTPPYSIVWSGDTAPLSATDISNPQFSTLTEGTYDLTLEVTDLTGCTDQASITITVEPITVSFTPNTVEVCAGSSIQLTPVVNGGTGTYISHVWSGTATDKLSATDVEQPTFTSLDPGSVILTYQVTDDMGCSNQADITIQVKEQPLAAAGPDQLVCGNTTILSGNVIPSAAGQWQVLTGPGTLTFNDASRADAQITADDYGEYQLMWEQTLNGCSQTDETTIRFSRVPSPTTGDDKVVCGTTTPLEAIPDLGTGTWSVVSGPGNSTFTDASNPGTEVSVDQTGIYTFRWSEQNADLCTGTADQTIDFKPQAEALITPITTEGCSPMEIPFTNESVNADSYRWDFGDGATSSAQHPTHIFENNTSTPKTSHITLIARNSNFCNDTLSIDVTTNPSPQARMTADPLSGCTPLETSFTNTSIGGNSYLWNFGDGTPESTDFEPVHTFINPENYVQSFPVKLTATNLYACTDTTNLFLSVFPGRDLTLKATPSEGCSALEVTLVADPGFRDYQWDFGDGESATGTYQITHLFENPGPNDATFEVTVTGTTSLGCVRTTTTTVKVFPVPTPDFTPSPLLLNMPESTVTLTNNTAGNWNYRWTFGDGSFSDEADPATHTYLLSGTYDITLEAFSDQCSSQLSKTIEITPMLPLIDYGQDAEGCPPLTVDFENNTLDATSYLWDFGDGQISGKKTPSHTYQIPGLYTVKLTATGPGGTSSAEDVTIFVYDIPTALFEAVPTLIFVPDDEVVFRNSSIGAIKYDWDFGDGTTSTEYIPSHLYTTPGLYDVTLSVENEQGCKDEVTKLGAVKAEQGGEMSFPNAFTPNPDGPSDGQYDFGDRSNHVFYPSVQKGIVEYELQIFSRWGEILFQSHDTEKGWDGYYKNKLCPQGVYIWRVKAKFSNGHTTTRAGDVTLLR